MANPKQSKASSADPTLTTATGQERTSRRGKSSYTIHDVAALAGVSSITASRFFSKPHMVSEKLRARIESVLVQTGYVPSQIARRLASSSGGPVGAVMQNVTSPTFAEMVKGMTTALDEQGLQLLLANSAFSQDAEERAVRTFAGWSPSGLILTRGDHLPSTLQTIKAMGMLIVEAWEINDDSPFHQVGFRQSEVGAMLARHFIEQGATRIRFARTGALRDRRSERRAIAYANEMLKAGLPADIVLVDEEDEYQAGMAHIARIAQSPKESRPQAVIFANDQMALAALLRGADLGIRVPQDCAIAGFGDSPISGIIKPGITSVRTQPYEIGRQAAQTLCESLQIGSTRVVRNIPCELVVRASSIVEK